MSNGVVIRNHTSGSVRVELSGYLGSRFDAYRTAVEQSGARTRKVGGRWETTLPVLGAPKLLALLERAEIHVEVESTDLAATINRAAQGVRATVAEGDARLEAADVALASTGRALRAYQREGVRWLCSRAAQGAVLADDMGLGKAQALDARILTPTGWRTMGELRVGDRVIGSNGRSCAITGVFPQGEKDIYRVVFNDGTSAECCDEHLWAVNTPLRRSRGSANRVMSLAEIRKSIVDSVGNRQHFIPMVAPVEFESDTTLPLHPYLVGYLIGNGGLTGHMPIVSIPDDVTVVRITNLLPSGVELRKRSNDPSLIDYTITTGLVGNPNGNPVTSALRELGLMGKHSQDKSVPSRYLFASSEVRLELLRGLMDSDGSGGANGVVEFCSTSERLVDEVQFLVETFGGSARKSASRVTQYTHNNEKRDGRPSWRLTVAMPTSINPFRLERKAERVVRDKYQPTRAIADVVYVGRKQAQCIAVDAEDHLYVTEHCIVTHNTAQALIALPNSARTLVVCPAVAKGVWRREVAKWRSELRVTILEGRGCLTRWPEAGEVLVVNYDVLSDPPAGPCPEGLVLIADEAHALKNGKSLRTSRFRAISDTARAAGGRTWLVTATPLTNRPQELWSVLRAAGLEKEAFGNWPRFVGLFDGVDGQFGGIEWGTNVSSQVPEMLRRVMLRRDKRDVAKDLPAKSREVRTVTLDREGLRAVEAEIKALLKDDASIDDLLEEIANGDVAFEQLARLRAALAGAKLPSVLELVEQFEDANEPLVVFSAHRVVIDALAQRPGWGRITGSETAEEKSAVEDAFQRGELKGVAATIKAGGVAITLTRACNSIFVDHAWTPADNLQAEDRIYRIGQTRPVLITCLHANHPIDERVEELLMMKTHLYEQSIGAARLQIGEVRSEVLAADAINIETPGEAVTAAAKPAKAYRRRLYWRDETTADPDSGEAHAPSNALETWAATALATLSALDPDRAMQENGVGFNKADGSYGHTLSYQLRAEGLTNRGWKAAIKLLAKYHRQIGRAPKTETGVR